jgi:hypothetical protein
MIDKKIISRIEWFAKNKINAFAPTISPAPKNFDLNEIESIYEALNYFVNNNISDVIIQKKYMGSYCDIYLHRNLEETYFVSRNGYVIKHIDLNEAKESLKELHVDLLNKYPDFNVMIISSELMPWKALGKGLIEEEFYGYLESKKIHNDFLKNNNLYEKIEQIKNNDTFVNYISDKKTLSKQELNEKYKQHIIRQYDSLEKLVILDLNQDKNAIDLYEKQINHFYEGDKIYFKPFNIQKIINLDGSEFLPNTNLTYSIVNNDYFININDLNKDNIQSYYEYVKNWLNTLTNDLEEGIVIKPSKQYIKGIVPGFKIRNNNYLTMIYGLNFFKDFEYYIKKRNIKSKMECSINDWEINWQMLNVKYNSLNNKNYLIKLLLLKRIENENIENTLDKRL